MGFSWHMRPVPFSGDHERSLVCDDVDCRRVDAGKLDHDSQDVWVVGVEAVDVGPEASPQSGEARHLPELREQLLDLLLQPVATCHPAHRTPGERSPSAANVIIGAWRS